MVIFILLWLTGLTNSVSFRSARLSILFSMIRIDPSQTRQRRLMYIGASFSLIWVLLIAQLFWVCESAPSWKELKSPQCPLDKQVAICQLVCK